MIADSVQFCGYRCFKNSWAGFEKIMPINVIIRRNNTGKSHLIDLAAACCEENLYRKDWRYLCRGRLDKSSLGRVFPADTSGGALGGNFWEGHGRHFLDVEMTWEINKHGEPTEITFPVSFKVDSPHGVASTEARLNALRGIAKKARHQLTGAIFRRLLADRDIQPEIEKNELKLSVNGTGASNIIRRYIVSSSLSRNLIQIDLLTRLRVDQSIQPGELA